MKGNEEILKRLNLRLAEELTAINQYMVHSEMFDNWGYDELHKEVEKRAIDEMKHAEKLIGRILFLEGIPVVSNYNKMHIGSTVELMHKNDRKSEEDAIKAYNEDIKFASEIKDNGTKDLIQSILDDEEGHIDRLEGYLDQIEQMGLQVYLSTYRK
jgi:bacterioferritin